MSGLARDGNLPYSMPVFGLNGGEWFIVSFVTVMVVSAKYWPAVGLRVGQALARRGGDGRSVETSASEPPRSP